MNWPSGQVYEGEGTLDMLYCIVSVRAPCTTAKSRKKDPEKNGEGMGSVSGQYFQVKTHLGPDKSIASKVLDHKLSQDERHCMYFFPDYYT